jgi:hypothetical protein
MAPDAFAALTDRELTDLGFKQVHYSLALTKR